MSATVLALAAAVAVLSPLVSGPPQSPVMGADWRIAGLPRQTLPLTRFSAETVDGRPAVRIDADASYGNLVFDTPGLATPVRLRWAWRVERPNTTADLRRKAGDDAAAKVCLSFDLPLDRLPFDERMLMQIARGSSGIKLPAATLCWAWGATEPAGSLVDNPYSRRVRTLVLRQAANAQATWFDEDRDVAADFRRAFGDEWPADRPLPPLLAVLVGGDADNTRAHSVAHVTGLRFDAAAGGMSALPMGSRP